MSQGSYCCCALHCFHCGLFIRRVAFKRFSGAGVMEHQSAVCISFVPVMEMTDRPLCVFYGLCLFYPFEMIYS